MRAKLSPSDFEAVTAGLRPPEGSYIVIVTRGHRDDMRVLRWAVNTRARYLGMIGSRRKTISIYKELEKEGIPAEKFANVHAPVGLEIGAVTPEEIAVAIVAEMIAVRRHAATNVASKMYSYPAGRQEQDAIEEETTRAIPDFISWSGSPRPAAPWRHPWLATCERSRASSLSPCAADVPGTCLHCEMT